MNHTSDYQFTIIVPFYNEEENAAAMEKNLASFLPLCSMSPACVLFVDDGSTDNGPALVKEICSRHDGFFYIRLERNTGLSGALKAGFDNCFSPWLGYIDADFQTDPVDFNLLLQYAGEYEMVTGVRAKRNDGFVKKASSRFANAFRRAFTHDGVSDTGCPLKVIRTDVARRFPMFTGMHRFLPALTQMAGGKVKQVEVRHYPRIAGHSKYHLFNRILGPLGDCFGYRWMSKRYINYRIKDDSVNEQ
ncbi:MAG: glycosyltransferase family 2 protein [Bacteroidales bacterium]|nr:glycosyltransferase family 2 protein [Bacteroidales bacterium]